MLIDRMKISLKINAVQETQIYKFLSSSRPRNIRKNKVKGITKYWFNDEKYDFSIELVLPFNDLYIIMNPGKINKNDVNVGNTTYKALKSNIKFIQKKVENVLKISLPNFITWKIESIEINNDTIHRSYKEKEAVLNALSLNDAGHLRRKDTNNLWSSWKKRGLKIKLYDKNKEVLTHYKDGFKLPNSCSVSDLNFMTRLELTIQHNNLLPTLNSILGTDKKVITLGELLNPYILVALFNSIVSNFNLDTKLQSFDKVVEIINTKIKRKDMREHYIDIIVFVNKYGVNVAKQRYGSSFYRYKKHLKELGVNLICLEGPYEFNALLDYNFVNLKFLKEFIMFFNVRSNFSIMNNMYILFIIFKAFRIPFRL